MWCCWIFPGRDPASTPRLRIMAVLLLLTPFIPSDTRPQLQTPIRSVVTFVSVRTNPCACTSPPSQGSEKPFPPKMGGLWIFPQLLLDCFSQPDIASSWLLK